MENVDPKILYIEKPKNPVYIEGKVAKKLWNQWFFFTPEGKEIFFLTLGKSGKSAQGKENFYLTLRVRKIVLLLSTKIADSASNALFQKENSTEISNTHPNFRLRRQSLLISSIIVIPSWI